MGRGRGHDRRDLLRRRSQPQAGEPIVPAVVARYASAALPLLPISTMLMLI